MKSLFITDPGEIDAETPGGVQICSREFLDIVKAGSSETRRLDISVSRKWIFRVRRRLGLGSYLLYDRKEFTPIIAGALQEFQPTHVFLNKAELVRAAEVIKVMSRQTMV